jgi:hypothetical protein
MDEDEAAASDNESFDGSHALIHEERLPRRVRRLRDLLLVRPASRGHHDVAEIANTLERLHPSFAKAVPCRTALLACARSVEVRKETTLSTRRTGEADGLNPPRRTRAPASPPHARAPARL